MNFDVAHFKVGAIYYIKVGAIYYIWLKS